MKTATQDDGDKNPKANEKKKSRFWRRFTTTAIFFLVLVIGGAGYFWSRFQRPIDVENATTGELVGWLTLRDLSAESPETRDRLFNKYFEAISTTAGNETIKIDLPPNIKRFSGVFFAGRDEKIADWDANRTRPPYWRLDYVVVPQEPRTSEFVLSSDVRPGPALLERWEKSRVQRKIGGAQKSLLAIEKNVKLLIMQWFVSQYANYDATPDDQKKEQVDRSASELLRWQDFYNGLRANAKIPPASRSDLLKEFEASIEAWNEFATAEEIAKVLWFKDLLESVLAARENAFQKISLDFRGKQAPSKSSETLDSADAPNVPANAPYPPRVANGNRTANGGGALFNAFRRYVFLNDGENGENDSNR